MSSDEAALLRMICESPQDDLPRLILADWYQENDFEDRAEFIRLDLLRNRTPDTLEAQKIYVELYRIWNRISGAWLESLPSPAGVRWENEFDGGLPCSVAFATPKAFTRSGPEVFESSPIRSLHLARFTPGTTPLFAESPALRGLSRFQLFWSSIQDEGVVRLMTTRWLGSLKELNLSGNLLGIGGARAIADCPKMQSVRILVLAQNQLEDDAAEVLFYSQWLTDGLRLYLAGNQISTPWLTRLQNRYRAFY